MCGRFFFEGDLEEVIRKFSIDILDEKDRDYGEIFPSNEFPIVYNKGNVSLAHYRWGFSAPYMKNLIINARLETLDSKPMFKGAFKERRCLIPLNYYFEWKLDDGKKKKHKIFMENQDLFYMAGLYGSFNDKKGEPYQGFTIITKNASPSISEIHDRMPLILEDDKLELWLDYNMKETTLLKNVFSEFNKYEDLLSALPV